MKDASSNQIQKTRLNVHNGTAGGPNLPQDGDDGSTHNLPKKLSRRKLLHDSIIAATGTVLLPSFITGCRKEDYGALLWGHPHGELGLTQAELEEAAANLTRLRVWINDLYPLCIEYEDAVFHALASTKENGSWTNFIVDIFIDIAIGLASAAAIGSGNAWVMPAIAGLTAFLHDWGIGKDKPTNLDAEFAEFQFGHEKMQLAIEQKLSSLVDPFNNYSNLKEAWKNNIEFNGTTYTLGDLASSKFPGLGDEYNNLQTAAHTFFKKALWNLVIMKCCKYYRNWGFGVTLKGDSYNSLTFWARQNFYPQNKGVYLRGYVQEAIPRERGEYWMDYWNLGINEYPFPDEASNILFKDDTPGHIINPDGLFNRTYVFEQFSMQKPDFNGWHELGKSADSSFSMEDDWNFTGGLFPKLTH